MTARVSQTDWSQVNCQFGSRMIAPLQTLIRSALGSATRASDYLFSAVLQKSSLRLSEELDLPPHLIQQVLAIEDKRFAWHPGVDPLAMIRAAVFNVGIGPARPHGASTIAQQVYSAEARRTGKWASTPRFKLAQSVWAIDATWNNSKATVLRNYLDSIYFGKSFYGLRQAALGYCGRLPRDLGIVDSFFLVERIAMPNRVSVRRVEMLVSRTPIAALFRAERHVMTELPAYYERHFECGERIARCLEKYLRKRVEPTSTYSAVVSSGP